MPQMPQAPGIGEQLLMNVGGKIATNVAGKAVNSIMDSFKTPQANLSAPTPGAVGEMTSSSTGNIGAGLGDFGDSYDIGDALNYTTPAYGLAAGAASSSIGLGGLGAADWASPTYSLAGATGAKAVGGLSSAGFSGYGAGLGDFGSAVGSGIGSVASTSAAFNGGYSAAAPWFSAEGGGAASAISPFGGPAASFVGPALALATGNVGGAIGGLVGNAVGAAVGSSMGGAALGAVLGPIGGIVGAVFGGGGGSVICTELTLRNDATLTELQLEYRYVRTLSDSTIRGYRLWAVPVTKIMRRNERVYAFVRPIAKRFMKESAARVGHGKETLLGMITIPVALAICWTIGQFVGDTDYEHLYGREVK
jgi:hypothetical protein